MIYIEPSPILKQKCSTVDVNDNMTIDTIFGEMFNEFNKIKGIQGLAAPQIGHAVSIVILKDIKTKEVIKAVNPKYVFRWGWATSKKEGCESVVGRYNVRRPTWCILRYYDWDKKKYITRYFKWPFTRVISHELDHLNGITISMKGKRPNVK